MSWFRKNRCYNGGALHNFEARYTERSEPRGKDLDLELQYIPYFEVAKILRANSKHEKIYKCDVCIWCGKTNVNVNQESEKRYE
ncbi:MAG: hypothetical protein D4S01_10790 [Dehalococcoidia bacterium]|nr:MAG: hypothetical protein D4S01_10790 [Dehalococcoidia bacterium]